VALQPATRIAGARPERRIRAALVISQVALGLVLLVTAGLLFRTFQKLRSVDPNFDVSHVMTFRIALPDGRYPTPDAIKAFSRQLSSSLRTLPGVESVGAISHLPYDDLPNWSTPYLKPELADPSLAEEADTRAVTPGFFEAVRARLLEGVCQSRS
jgi:putative ABC transport system permease protein